eukprot:GEMP01047973.1.p1 GENE.GEMP01047973.1~~GEMP01047973.1.p1  ORF type:complete len:540 (+),score=110.74 GEMP01047973.1:61-1620(+)
MTALARRLGIGTSLHATARFGVQSRYYVDTRDRAVALKSMESPDEVLAFYSENADMSADTLEKTLRQLSKKQRIVHHVVNDERFKHLLAQLTGRLADMDARSLAMIADATARFRENTLELHEFAMSVASACCTRPNAFSPRLLSTLALALSYSNVRDPVVSDFIRKEAMNTIMDAEPQHCILYLQAFRRWGIFDRELTDSIVERMQDEVDRFMSKDVVDALQVFGRLGVGRGFMLKRLSTLAFENLHQFTPKQNVEILYSLTKLRFLTMGNVDDIVDTLRPHLSELGIVQLADLVFALAFVNYRDEDLIRLLSNQLMDGMQNDQITGMRPLVNCAWAICNYPLIWNDEEYVRFAELFNNIVERSVPRSREYLSKMFEVFQAVDQEWGHCKLSVPASWRAACEEADRMEQTKTEISRLHSEILTRLDRASKAHVVLRTLNLELKSNIQLGKWNVDFGDERAKLAIDVETLSRVTSRDLKHRLMVDEGFKVVVLDYWQWRQCRTEEDQTLFVERKLEKALR